MNMVDRPLWIDISEHQGLFDFSKMDTDNRVSGVVSRAGVGHRVDPEFVRNYSQSKKADKYRTSYWAIDPKQIIQPQLDKWVDIHPILDRIPRMLDAELNGSSPLDTGMDIKASSDYLADYDNVRPWLYFGRYFAMDNVIPFVSHDWLNEHYIVLAQYDMGDGKEYESVIIPDGIDPERVIFKQTSDKMKLYSGGPVIDRDRFLLGGLPEMYAFMNSQLDGTAPPIEPPPPTEDCCEGLREALIELENNTSAYILDNQKDIDANTDEIEKLEAYVESEFLLAYKKINTNTNQIHLDAVKSMSMDAAMEGQINQHDDDITKLRAEVDDSVDAGAFNLVVDKLNARLDELLGKVENTYSMVQVEELLQAANDHMLEVIDGITLKTNHSHPDWMYKWGIVK